MKNIKLNWKSMSIIQSLLLASFLFVSFTNQQPQDIPVPVVSVAAEKMNVFYIGVDNPISVAVSSLDAAQVSVKGKNVKVKEAGRGRYIATVTTPGVAEIIVNGNRLDEQVFKFRVKRIPDPIPALGAGPSRKGGTMGNGEFTAQEGIRAVLENFDMDATCSVQSYELTRRADNEDPVMSMNRGARFNTNTQRIVKLAKSGDNYFFDNITVRCPGDQVGRYINSMVFRIK